MFVVYEEARETVLPQRPATDEATTAYQWAAVTRGESAYACWTVVSFQLDLPCNGACMNALCTIKTCLS